MNITYRLLLLSCMFVILNCSFRRKHKATFVRLNSNSFRVIHFENDDLMIINDRGIYHLNLQEDDNYSVTRYAEYNGQFGTTIPLYNSYYNEYLVSGIYAGKEYKIVLIGKIKNNKEIVSITTIPDVYVFDVKYCMTLMKDHEYMVSYVQSLNFYILKFNRQTNEISVLLKEYFGISGIKVSFQCHYLNDLDTTLCMLIFPYVNGNCRFYYYNNAFELYNSTYPEEQIIFYSQMVSLELKRINKSTVTALFVSVQQICLFFIETGSGKLKLDTIFYQSKSYEEGFGILPLNENSFILYYTLTSLFDDGRTMKADLYDIKTRNFVLNIFDGDNSVNSHLGLFFSSVDSKRIFFLNHQIKEIFVYETKLIECTTITIPLCGYEVNEIDIYDFYLDEKMLKDVFIKFYNIDYSGKNFLFEGVPKDEEEDEYSLVRSNVFYRKLRAQFKGDLIKPFDFFLYQDNSESLSFSRGTFQASFTYDCDSCFKSCLACEDKGNILDHKCTYCKEGYYFMEGKTNCYQELEGFFLEKSTEVLRPCHKNCKTCKQMGKDTMTNCLSCAQGYSDLSVYSKNETDKGNCVKFCDLDSNNWFIGIEDKMFTCRPKEDFCPSTLPYLDKTKSQCVSSKTSPDQNLNVSLKDLDVLMDKIGEKLEYLRGITPIVTGLYSLHFNDQTEVKGSFSVIDLGEECKKLIEDYYFVSEESLDIIVMDIYPDYARSSSFQANQVEYLIFAENKRVDLSICSDTLIHFKSKLKHKELLNYDTLKEVTSNEKNKDINLFDATDDFFNDPCYSFISSDDYDIVLTDRRKFYFQNITIEENCKVDKYDIETEIIYYSCKPKLRLSTSKKKTNVEQNQFKNAVNDFTLKYLNCYNRIFESNTTSNIGAILCITELALQVGILIYFFSIPNKFTDGAVHSWSPPIKKGKDDRYHKSRVESAKKRIFLEKGNITKMCLKDKSSSFFPLEGHPGEFQEIAKANAESKESSVIELGKSDIDKTETFKTKISKGCAPAPCSDQSPSRFQRTMSTPKNEESQEFFDDNVNSNFVFRHKYTIKQKFDPRYLSIVKKKHFVYLAFIQKVPRLIRCIRIANFLNDILMIMFFNAFLYNDNHISEHYKSKRYNLFNELLMMLLGFVLMIFCKSIFETSSDYSYFIDKKRRVSKNYRRYRKVYKIRLIIVFIIMIILQLLMAYFLTAFLNIFQSIRSYWLINSCFVLYYFLVFPFNVSAIIYIFGGLGIRYKSKRLFSVASFLL